MSAAGRVCRWRTSTDNCRILRYTESHALPARLRPALKAVHKGFLSGFKRHGDTARAALPAHAPGGCAASAPCSGSSTPRWWRASTRHPCSAAAGARSKHTNAPLSSGGGAAGRPSAGEAAPGPPAATVRVRPAARAIGTRQPTVSSPPVWSGPPSALSAQISSRRGREAVSAGRSWRAPARSCPSAGGTRTPGPRAARLDQQLALAPGALLRPVGALRTAPRGGRDRVTARSWRRWGWAGALPPVAPARTTR
jgi:hypothetical protein